MVNGLTRALRRKRVLWEPTKRWTGSVREWSLRKSSLVRVVPRRARRSVVEKNIRSALNAFISSLDNPRISMYVRLGVVLAKPVSERNLSRRRTSASRAKKGSRPRGQIPVRPMLTATVMAWDRTCIRPGRVNARRHSKKAETTSPSEGTPHGQALQGEEGCSTGGGSVEARTRRAGNPGTAVLLGDGGGLVVVDRSTIT